MTAGVVVPAVHDASRGRITHTTIGPGAGPSSASRTPKGGRSRSGSPADSVAVIALHRENAALESAKKLLTARKKHKNAQRTTEGVKFGVLPRQAANQKGKGKGKDGETPRLNRLDPPRAATTCDGCSVPVLERLG